MIGVRNDLAVGAVGRQALEILDLQRLVGRPCRRAYAAGNREINKLHRFGPPN